jgi:hypothetical protein
MLNTTSLHDPSRQAGILFAEDFDISASLRGRDELADEPRIIPAQPLLDVEAIRLEAFTKGLAEGHHAATARIDAETARRDETALDILRKVAAGLTEAGRNSAHVSEIAALCVARVMLGALEALLPTLCERHGAAEVAAMARALLPALVHDPHVQIRAHPSAIAMIQVDLARLDADLRSHIVLAPNKEMATGDIRVVWQGGSANRDGAGIRQAVRDALQLFGLIDVPDKTPAPGDRGAPGSCNEGQPSQTPLCEDSR